MNKRNFTIAASTTFAIALLVASPAHATVLNAGGSGIPTVFGFNLGTETLLADTGIQSYNTNVGGTIEKGSYEARVYRSGSFLDFVYDFNETASSTTAINTVTMANFGGFVTDVFYIATSTLPGTLVTETSASRSADGNVIKYSLPLTGVGVGQAATEMVIRVTAQYYNPGLYSIQNGVTTNLAGYQPTATPEPASLAMIGAGLLVLGVYRRRSA